MITFTVSTKKGGVGKTTTAISLLDIFTEMGYKCLGVDLDGQGNLTKAAGVFMFSETSRDLFLNKSANPVCKSRGFDIIAADKTLDEVEKTIFDRYNSHTVLRSALTRYQDQYDVCVLDCSSSMDMVTKNALVAADHVVCPIAPEGFSFDGFDEIEKEVKNINDSGLNAALDIACIVLHKYHKNFILHQTILEHFDNSAHIIHTVREKLSVSESQYQSANLLEYDPAGAATSDLVSIAKYIESKYLLKP